MSGDVDLHKWDQRSALLLLSLVEESLGSSGRLEADLPSGRVGKASPSAGGLEAVLSLTAAGRHFGDYDLERGG